MEVDQWDVNLKAFEIQLCELVEEVKHYRNSATENEKKYFRTLDLKTSLTMKLKEQEDQHRFQLQEYEKALHSKNQKIAEEKLNTTMLLRKKDLQISIVEKERDSLKQEIRNNALSVYESSRRISNLEQEMRVEKKARAAAETYGRSLEQEIRKLETFVDNMQQEVLKLAVGAKETVRMARVVNSSFGHADCLIAEARKETGQIKKELLIAEAEIVRMKNSVDNKPSVSKRIKEEPMEDQGLTNDKRIEELRKCKTELIAANAKSSELLESMRKELESETKFREKASMDLERRMEVSCQLKEELDKSQTRAEEYRKALEEHKRTASSQIEILELQTKEQRREIERLEDEVKGMGAENETLRVDMACRDDTESLSCHNRIIHLEAEVEGLRTRLRNVQENPSEPTLSLSSDKFEGSRDPETPHSTTGD